MKDKRSLPENHLRSVSSSMYLIEKLLLDIQHVFLENGSLRMLETTGKITPEKREVLLQTIKQISLALNQFADKYQLTKQTLSQGQIINSRKAKMWEILNNTTSDSLKGFGTFPPELKDEFDADLHHLLQLVEKIG